VGLLQNVVMSGDRWVQHLGGEDKDWVIREGDKRNPSSVEDSPQSTTTNPLFVSTILRLIASVTAFCL